MRNPRTFIPTINDRLEIRMVPSGVSGAAGDVAGHYLGGGGGGGGGTGAAPLPGSTSGSGSTTTSNGG